MFKQANNMLPPGSSENDNEMSKEHKDFLDRLNRKRIYMRVTLIAYLKAFFLL